MAAFTKSPPPLHLSFSNEFLCDRIALVYMNPEDCQTFFRANSDMYEYYVRKQFALINRFIIEFNELVGNDDISKISQGNNTLLEDYGIKSTNSTVDQTTLDTMYTTTFIIGLHSLRQFALNVNSSPSAGCTDNDANYKLYHILAQGIHKMHQFTQLIPKHIKSCILNQMPSFFAIGLFPHGWVEFILTAVSNDNCEARTQLEKLVNQLIK